jgi:hypothetical protein
MYNKLPLYDKMTITLNEVTALLITLNTVVQGGVVSSGFVYIPFKITQKIASMLGWEPLDPSMFIRIFERGFQFIFAPIESKAESVDTMTRGTEAFLIGYLGVLVAFAAFAAEIIGLFSVTVVAYASFHVFGVTVDILSLYRLVIAFVCLFVFAILSHGNQRIQTKSYA